MVSINTNLAALTAQRSLAQPSAAFAQSVQRLSSGLRLNSAKDDAAGDFLSTKLRAQVGGFKQASRNAQDGQSYLQTAEGGLMQMAEIVSRMRELAVQANNGVYTAQERTMLQAEVDQSALELTRIAQSTRFNGTAVLQGGNSSTGTTPAAQLVEGLRRSWLRSSEQLILQNYGIAADGAALPIFADASYDGPGGALAFVQGTPDASGRYINMSLHVDMSDFTDFSLPNGGAPAPGSTQYLDRVLAHEMTHAIMSRSMNFDALPTWFVEGTAEYTCGADDRVKADTANQTTTAALVAGSWDSAWSSSSADYSAGYSAVKYLDSKLGTVAKTMTGFMDQLESNLASPTPLDVAVAWTGLWADTNAFVADFKANGTAFINGLNLNDADVGAIGGGDASAVIPDINIDTVDPLIHFVETWPAGTPAAGVTLHIGTGSGSTDEVGVSNTFIDAASMGLDRLDLVNDAGGAIDQLDLAVESIASIRSGIGAAMNRIDYALRVIDVQTETFTAATARIRDADVAFETTNLVRSQLLRQSAMTALSQATSSPNLVLSLLR